MAALNLKNTLAEPPWDLAIFGVAVLSGVVEFAEGSRWSLAITALVAVGLLKWRLDFADRLRDQRIRTAGVGSKLNYVLAMVIVMWSLTAIVALTVK